MTNINILELLVLHHVLSEKQGSIFILLCVTVKSDQNYLLALSVLQYVLLMSVKTQMTAGIWASL